MELDIMRVSLYKVLYLVSMLDYCFQDPDFVLNINMYSIKKVKVTFTFSIRDVCAHLKMSWGHNPDSGNINKELKQDI